jgi:ribosome-associated protein
VSEPLVVDDRITIPGADLVWTSVRSSGPGGQNVNKVASKVELRFLFSTTAALDVGTRNRLRTLAKGKFDADENIVIVSQATRDREKNLEDAREKLRLLVLAALVVPKKRRPTRPTRGARERRLEEKSRHAQKKRDRRGD